MRNDAFVNQLVEYVARKVNLLLGTTEKFVRYGLITIALEQLSKILDQTDKKHLLSEIALISILNNQTTSN